MKRRRNEAAVMPQISATEQDRLLKILRLHQRSLKVRAGVKSVGIGYAFKNGKPTNELALVAVVDNKVPLERLARKDRIPRRIGGVRTDVVEKRRQLLASPTDVFDPLMGGIQIQTMQGLGTLGCIVFGNGGAIPYGLTNQHVVIPTGSTPGSPVPVAQPLTTPINEIGRYVKSDTRTDSALVSVDGTGVWPPIRSINTAIFGGVSAPSKGTGMPVLGMRVRKCGRTTGTTDGIISGIDTMDREFTIFPDRTVMAANRPLLALGDSGSVIFETSTGRVIGLLNAAIGFPGDPDLKGGAALISYVLRALDCFIYDDQEGMWCSSAWIGGSGLVFVIIHPNVEASLSVRYPSGRISSAKGLGPKRADRNGFIRWQWTVGTSTGRRPNVKCEAHVSIGRQRRVGYFSLKGVTRTDR